MTDMNQMLYTMENSLRLQNQARAERRARKAEQEKKEFQEKLLQASASKIELDGILGAFGFCSHAVQRDQLLGMMGSM